jgi:hypothetical protein
MKKLLITTAALFALATPALAIDLGNGWVFDNTVTLEYFVEAETTAATYEAELSYALNTEVTLYAYTEVDLKDVDFTGLDLGVNYAPDQLKYVNFNAEVQLDDKFSYNELVLTAEVRF